jgi:beta-glucanase (GH16 family)
VTAGQATSLSWATTNASSCTASGAWSGAQAVSGSETSGALSSDSTFTLNCVGPGGTVQKSVLVTAKATASSTLFFDDFLGTSIDPAKWVVMNRISDQVNNELNCVIPENITVQNGVLSGVSKFEDHVCGDSIEAPQTMHYTSWQIQQATSPFLYGTIEVRAKEPGGTGIWPTIFLLGYLWQPSQPYTANVAGNNWPVGGWCEIDIAEFLNNLRNQVNNVVHYNVPGGTNLRPLPFDATSRFMVYRLQWTASSLTWSVDAEDGVGYRTLYTITDPSRIPNVPMYLTINAAIGGIGVGTPNPNTFPQTFQVDYVRITQ